MNESERYEPGAADVARVHKDGEMPEKVWRALTAPEHLHEWAPFDASADLGNLGTVNLTWVGAPEAVAARITVVDAPKLLEYESA